MGDTNSRMPVSNRGRIKPPDVDAKSLEVRLRSSLKGEVRFDPGYRALYATDGSNYRHVPIGVVIPRDKEDIVKAMALCREYGAPVLARGGGTSLGGQCCNVAVVLDVSKYMRSLLELNPAKRFARVLPGIVLDDLRKRAEKHHLTFAPDPATHNHNTLGGMMGNNSCGPHSVMGGKTDENVEELEILTYDGLRMTVGKTSENELEEIIRAGGRRGEIYLKLKDLRDKYAGLIRDRYPKMPRRVSGYNLNFLLPEHGFDVAKALIGSEGTCVTILEARLRLMPSPPVRSLLVLGYPDAYEAGDEVPEIMENHPIALEGVDGVLVDNMHKKGYPVKDTKLLPEGGGWLLVEFGGRDKDESDGRARQLMNLLKSRSKPPSTKLFDIYEEEQKVWEIRESGLGATARVPGENHTHPGWEDSAVPPERVGEYLRKLRGLLKKYDYACALYGHFGQGCIHTRIDFDMGTHDGVNKFRSFMIDAADLVLSLGGSLSGEHGDGQARAELLPKMFGDELVQAFREFKSIWDPSWKMNPGKIVDAYGITDNLREGPDHKHPSIPTHFSFSSDQGNFTDATLRCVGIGKCRREESGVMCPSYMVTHEEMHSTRGRTHLLFEMIQGDPLKAGWRDEAVRDALDLCLSCKGCKGECPGNVDVATYKAEFLSHYYKWRLRPFHAYAFGLINIWSYFAAFMPNVVNFFTQSPIASDILRSAVGISPERRFPAFASQTFRDWFRRRGPRNQGRPKVLLFPDTFNNYFHPETAEAATEVLENGGFQVVIPGKLICCGRPLYDYGMLDLAEIYLKRVLKVLQPQIDEGTPMVVLEPSCLSVFRDEMPDLLPGNRDAEQLRKQSFLLSEFLGEQAESLPQLKRNATVHGHCHHKAVLSMDSEKSILSRLGVSATMVDSGCCGMAGAFGFEKEHYGISIQCGERVLLPAVRKSDRDSLIIADGFSCRTQIEQTTDRRALHLAQVIQMAIREGPHGPAGAFPEKRYNQIKEANGTCHHVEIALAVGAAAGAAAIGIRLANRIRQQKKKRRWIWKTVIPKLWW